MRLISVLALLLIGIGYGQGVSRYGTAGFGDAQSAWKYRTLERIFAVDVMLEEGIDRYKHESISQFRADSSGSYAPYAEDKMNYIGMGQIALLYAHDWFPFWRTGIRQSMTFQKYKIKAEIELDDRKGMSFSDFHYWDQFRLFQNKHFTLGLQHELYVPWAKDFEKGAITHYSTNPNINRSSVKNLQSAGEYVQGLQFHLSYVVDRLPHDLGTAVHLNLGTKYYYDSEEFLPVAVLGAQARVNDEWVVWGTAGYSHTATFEQGIRYRPSKSQTIDFYVREAPFQDNQKFTWIEDLGDDKRAIYTTDFEQEPKIMVGFKVAYSWSPRVIHKVFSNADKYLEKHIPFSTFGESYFIPTPIVGDTVPMPQTTVYKGFEVDKILEPTVDSKERLDSIAEQMFQHPVRMELRIFYGEGTVDEYNKRLGEEIGVNLGNYLVNKGISKRRIRVNPMGKEGLEEWENARLVTKVYSLPLEPPQKLKILRDGVVKGIKFNRDGFLTDEGEARLRFLSMQMEHFDLQVEFLTRSNRSKDSKENLELSKGLAKTIGEFLVAAGVSPDDLRFQHLGDKDIPETENELIEVIVTQKEYFEE